MNEFALIFKEGFGRDESIILVSKKSNKVLEYKKNNAAKRKIRRLEDNKIEVLGIILSVNDGPLLSSSRKILFSHNGKKIFEFRAPSLRERFQLRYFTYYWKGFVFVGECDYSFHRISEIILICLNFFNYYGEPEAW